MRQKVKLDHLTHWIGRNSTKEYFGKHQLYNSILVLVCSFFDFFPQAAQHLFLISQDASYGTQSGKECQTSLSPVRSNRIHRTGILYIYIPLKKITIHVRKYTIPVDPESFEATSCGFAGKDETGRILLLKAMRS